MRATPPIANCNRRPTKPTFGKDGGVDVPRIRRCTPLRWGMALSRPAKHMRATPVSVLRTSAFAKATTGQAAVASRRLRIAIGAQRSRRSARIPSTEIRQTSAVLPSTCVPHRRLRIAIGAQRSRRSARGGSPRRLPPRTPSSRGGDKRRCAGYLCPLIFGGLRSPRLRRGLTRGLKCSGALGFAKVFCSFPSRVTARKCPPSPPARSAATASHLAWGRKLPIVVPICYRVRAGERGEENYGLWDIFVTANRRSNFDKRQLARRAHACHTRLRASHFRLRQGCGGTSRRVKPPIAVRNRLPTRPTFGSCFLRNLRYIIYFPVDSGTGQLKMPAEGWSE